MNPQKSSLPKMMCADLSAARSCESLKSARLTPLAADIVNERGIEIGSPRAAQRIKSA